MYVYIFINCIQYFAVRKTRVMRGSTRIFLKLTVVQTVMISLACQAIYFIDIYFTKYFAILQDLNPK